MNRFLLYIYEDEINAEIEALAPYVRAERRPDLESDDAIDDMAGIVGYYYTKGYYDALNWVKGEK
jgi:hypothetical protein